MDHPRISHLFLEAGSSPERKRDGKSFGWQGWHRGTRLGPWSKCKMGGEWWGIAELGVGRVPGAHWGEIRQVAATLWKRTNQGGSFQEGCAQPYADGCRVPRMGASVLSAEWVRWAAQARHL